MTLGLERKKIAESTAISKERCFMRPQLGIWHQDVYVLEVTTWDEYESHCFVQARSQMPCHHTIRAAVEEFLCLVIHHNVVLSKLINVIKPHVS